MYSSLLIAHCGGCNTNQLTHTQPSYLNPIIGKWKIDVEKTIEYGLKLSDSYINEENEGKKEFLVEMTRMIYPEVKYEFFADGNVNYFAPITENPDYIKTIWTKENDKLFMIILLKDLTNMNIEEYNKKSIQNIKLPQIELITEIEFIDSDNLKFYDKNGISYLIRDK